jgi:hypothetical protein
MILPDQMDKLVSKLTELTVKEKVEWQETAGLDTYLAPVDRFIVTISRSGSEIYGAYSLQIVDGTGRPIEGVVAPYNGHGQDKSAATRADWERLRDLYEIARRRALHSEKVVSDLLASLDRIA